MSDTYAAFAEKHLDVRTRSGAEWMCLCPYHEDTNPSFAINVRKGLFVCYACGVRGKVDHLANHLNVTGVHAETVQDIDEIKAKAEQVLAEPERAKTISPLWLEHWQSGDYLDHWSVRGITSPDVINWFSLGYDPMADALAIPVHHPAKNSVLSVVRRRLNPEEGQPKYKYEHGFKISEHLFGSWQVRQHAPEARAVVVTEGSIDALAMWQVGVPAVALLGARVSDEQSRLLRALDPRELIVMTDNDHAGIAARDDVRRKLHSSGIILSKPSYWPAGAKDPADMTEEQRCMAVESAKRIA